MASIGIAVTIGVKHDDGHYSLTPGAVPDPNGTAPDYTSVAADIATLVADGASPTQAHVTTLNGHWGTYKTAADAYTATASAVSKNVMLYFDPSALTNQNMVRDVMRHLEHQLMGRIPA